MDDQPIEGDVFKPLKPKRYGRYNPRKVTLDSQIGKYFIARKKGGMTKKKAALEAGYSLKTAENALQIENSESYQNLEKRYYKDKLLDEITLQEIAEAHADNIRQTKDRGAKNKAIEMALNKLEPDSHERSDDSIVVILKEE